MYIQYIQKGTLVHKYIGKVYAHAYVFMCVCIYLSIYVDMSVCVYLSMYVFIHLCLYSMYLCIYLYIFP